MYKYIKEQQKINNMWDLLHISDKALFFNRKVQYFSYFSMKTYVVGIH